MAGIGFELKKIFKERSVVSMIKGAFYSTFTIIGPMLIIIVGFLVMNIMMGYQNIGYAERDLLVSIVLYVFIFSLILTSPLAAVISRFIADKIFEENTDDVLASFYCGLVINMAIGFLACVPFAIITVIKGGVDPFLMFVSACMFFALMFVFYNLTFISAIKEYKSVAYSFTGGVALAVLVAIILHMFAGVSYTLSVVSGAAVGFTLIALILLSLIRRFFKVNSRKYSMFLSYLQRYYMLFLTNLFYIAGLYIHNFIFWAFSEYKIVVAGTFISAPIYDTATFLAMLTSVSATVIFTVRVEINFHQRYQVYCQELIGGIGEDIATARNNMFKTLVKEIFYLSYMQLILTVGLYMIIMIFGSSMGFGGLLLNIYPSLAAGYYIIFIMYCVIVFLYYFDDGVGAFISSLAFFVVTVIASVFALRLSPSFQGIGPVCGAFAGWTAAFFRLRYIENNLSLHMYCKGELLKKIFISQNSGRKKGEPEDLVLGVNPAILAYESIRAAEKTMPPPEPDPIFAPAQISAAQAPVLPVMEEIAAEEPVIEDIAEESVIEDTAAYAYEPAAEEIAEDESVIKDIAAEEPVIEETAEESVIEDIAAYEPVVEGPSFEESFYIPDVTAGPAAVGRRMDRMEIKLITSCEIPENAPAEFNPFDSLEFKLVSREDIYGKEGELIYSENTVIGYLPVDGHGDASIYADLPLGCYYVQEYSAPKGYAPNDTRYVIHFTHPGRGGAPLVVYVNSGVPIGYSLLRGSLKVTAVEHGAQTPAEGVRLLITGETLAGVDACFEAVTGPDGYVTLDGLLAGYYSISMIDGGASANGQIVAVEDGGLAEAVVQSYKSCGCIKIFKNLAPNEVSVNHRFAIAGTTDTGDYYYGEFEMDNDGTVCADDLPAGMYRVKEIVSDLRAGYVPPDEYIVSVAKDMITELIVSRKVFRR